MRKLLLSLLFLLPTAVLAARPECKHSQPRDLQLDLVGVKAVVFDIGANDLTIDASPHSVAALHGKACASDPELLEQLQLTQQKSGDKLFVSIRRKGPSNGVFFQSHYAYLKVAGTLPDSMTVQLKVGSGDARVTGAPIVSADVGSGDVEASSIRGMVAVKVNSGDIKLEDIGSLQAISVGSGDLVVKRVKGPVKVGSIGSGDFSLSGAAGDVLIGSIASGDADIRDISGNLRVDSLGSGDLDVSAIHGDFILRSKGSGSTSHKDVAGRVSVPGDN